MIRLASLLGLVACVQVAGPEPSTPAVTPSPTSVPTATPNPTPTVSSDTCDTGWSRSGTMSNHPSTWATNRTRADGACQTAWSCPPGSSAAVASAFDRCESGVEAYYDANGALISEATHQDLVYCGTNVIWFGPPVQTCPQGELFRSAGCAQPTAYDRPPVVATTSFPPPLGTETWEEMRTRRAGSCYGTRLCPLPSGIMAGLTFDYRSCGYGRFAAWDVSQGPLAVQTSQIGFGELVAPSLSAEDRGVLSTCLGLAFVPEPDCGLPSLP